MEFLIALLVYLFVGFFVTLFIKMCQPFIGRERRDFDSYLCTWTLFLWPFVLILTFILFVGYQVSRLFEWMERWI